MTDHLADWKRYANDDNRIGCRYLNVDCEINVQRFVDDTEEWTVRVFPRSVSIDSFVTVTAPARDEDDAKTKAETLAARDY